MWYALYYNDRSTTWCAAVDVEEVPVLALLLLRLIDQNKSEKSIKTCDPCFFKLLLLSSSNNWCAYNCIRAHFYNYLITAVTVFLWSHKQASCLHAGFSLLDMLQDAFYMCELFPFPVNLNSLPLAGHVVQVSLWLMSQTFASLQIKRRCPFADMLYWLDFSMESQWFIVTRTQKAS